MSSHSNIPAEPKLEARQAKLEKHDHRVEHVFRRFLIRRSELKEEMVEME